MPFRKPPVGPDIEMNRVHSTSEQYLLDDHSSDGHKERQKKLQEFLQNGRPTFVPTFASLKEACLEHTCEQLRTIEEQIDQITSHSERGALLNQAVDLLQSLESQLGAIVNDYQLEDPEFASQRGISITHFNVETGRRRGTWKLLASNHSIASRSITESDPDKLTSLRRGYLQEFCGGTLPSTMAFKRPKELLEKQYHAVTADGELHVPNVRMKNVWCIILGLSYLASFGFLAVGIIATTTTFDEFFLKYFFWVAIVWTMASSSIMVGIVRAFGGNGRDSISVFLAAVAIWLVVIQIGQTKLNGQLGVDS